MSATTALKREVTTCLVESLRLTDVAVAGGKGANLGELIGAGFPVPRGFVVTAGAFLDAVEAAGVRHRLEEAVRAAATAPPAEIERVPQPHRRRPVRAPRRESDDRLPGLLQVHPRPRDVRARGSMRSRRRVPSTRTCTS